MEICRVMKKGAIGFRNCSRRPGGISPAASPAAESGCAGESPEFHESHQRRKQAAHSFDRAGGSRGLHADHGLLVRIGENLDDGVAENEADQGSDEDRDKDLEEAPAKLLKMVEKGHFRRTVAVRFALSVVGVYLVLHFLVSASVTTARSEGLPFADNCEGRTKGLFGGAVENSTHPGGRLRDRPRQVRFPGMAGRPENLRQFSLLHSPIDRRSGWVETQSKRRSGLQLVPSFQRCPRSSRCCCIDHANFDPSPGELANHFS